MPSVLGFYFPHVLELPGSILEYEEIVSSDFLDGIICEVEPGEGGEPK